MYFDDILTFSKDSEEHVQHVYFIPQRLLESKAVKCEFHASSVGFLGYIMEGGQVNTGSGRVAQTHEP